METTGGVTAAELARLLKARAQTVRAGVGLGNIQASPSVPGSRKRIIPEDQVAYWVRRFTRLQPGFDWLQARLLLRKQVPTLGVAGVARLLGVGGTTVRRWCGLGLLPHYIRSFGDAEEYALVADYVHGLAAFAGRTPVRIATARDYAAICAKVDRVL